jgi:hypothetical protein
MRAKISRRYQNSNFVKNLLILPSFKGNGLFVPVRIRAIAFAEFRQMQSIKTEEMGANG